MTFNTVEEVFAAINKWLRAHPISDANYLERMRLDILPKRGRWIKRYINAAVFPRQLAVGSPKNLTCRLEITKADWLLAASGQVEVRSSINGTGFRALLLRRIKVAGQMGEAMKVAAWLDRVFSPA